MRPSAFSLVVLVITGLLGYVGLTGLEQGVRAAQGEGVPGAFVAESVSCVQHPGHESCTCQGTFTPESAEDGAGAAGDGQDVRLHAADRSTCVEGEEVAAVDAGAADRVYGPDGSREWMLSALFVLVAVGAFGVVIGGWIRAAWIRGKA
ncbi:hypothetical protein [Nocardiopsis nanhaiensis]